MGHVTLKGPNRLGAAELDEGALTAAVVASYAQEDGSGGQAAAEQVLPARRALWQLAEVHLPRELAASLRARLARADQTGRDGVREMRRALADWLDPPPLCAYCRRGITPETAGVACTARPQRTWRGTGRHPAPTPCAASRGPQGLRAGARQARSVARCGTLALFTPIHLDPACAAAARLLRHGAAAYDLVVDRDARTLLEVTSSTHANSTATSTPSATIGRLSEHPAPARLHTHQSTTPEPVAAARRHFDRVLAKAIRANGPLALKCQLRQYSPNGSTTRADLVQGANMGLRRALLDYDPKVAKFSTYAIHWIRQGGGEAFADRDLVAVPDWAAGLRRIAEDRDLVPAQLLRLIGTVAETRPIHGAYDLVVDRDARTLLEASLQPRGSQFTFNAKKASQQKVEASQASGALKHSNQFSTSTAVSAHRHLGQRRAQTHAEAVAELAMYARLHLPVIEPARKASKGVAAKPAKTIVEAITVEAVVAGLLKAAAPKAKPAPKKPSMRPRKSAPVVETGDADEQARERVASYVAARLGMRKGVKSVPGGALLTALRSGTVVIVGIGTGEHDDAGGGDADSHGAGRQERLPEHLADDAPDPEEQAAEEDESRREMAALLAALESLRLADPEAAEVVRRRHAMDGLGDPETLEEIAAAPLRCTGRSRCREGVRQAYERGKAVLRTAAPALLAGLPADVGHEPSTVHVHQQVLPKPQHARSLPCINAIVESGSQPSQSPRRLEFHTTHYSTTPTPEEFGQWAADREAMMAAF